MAEPNPPRRQWYQFGLRTLFVAVTIIAVAFGWIMQEMKHVQQRNEYRDWLFRAGPSFYSYDALPPVTPLSTKPRISFWRRLLGDAAAWRLNLPRDASLAETQRARELFPEAEIYGRFSQEPELIRPTRP